MSFPRTARALRALVATLAGLALAACGDGPSGPPAVATVTVGAPGASLVVGTSRTMTAIVSDAKGNVLTGRTLRWTTSDGSVAAVNAAGLLTAVSPGSATITAEVEGRSGSTGVTVIPVPVASVSITPPALTLVVGGSQPLLAVARDANGTPLIGRTVEWTSGNAAVASVSAAGQVTAIAAGTATITATSEGRTATAAITVDAQPDAPRITDVTPAVLSAGVTTTITGVGFEAGAAANVVTVNGVQAPVTSASATAIVFTMPCIESGPVGVRVATRGAASAPFARPMTVPQRTLAIGQPLILTNNSASLCNELLTGATTAARYLVMVFSGSTSANVQVDFDIAGNSPPTGADPPAIRVAHETAAPTPRLDAAEIRQAARDREHFEHLERSRVELDRMLQEWQRLSPARRSSAVAGARAMVRAPSVGDERSFYYVLAAGTCSDSTAVIRTKAIHIGKRAVIWEDVTNSLQSSADPALLGFYQRLGRIYDEDQHESLRNTFGDPLLRDADTDGDGLVHMVYSQRLNGTGAAAYVSPCDQFPRSASPMYAGSNFGEVFYGQVPTVATPNVNSTSSPDGWFYFMARTVVHEVKHIVSIATRVANNTSQEQSWLEEGTARHAEEVWIRESLHRVPWKGNTGFGAAADNGIYCDFHPADATCNAVDPLRRPSYGMRRQFNEILPKLAAPHQWSPYGDGTGQSGSVFYQTAWSLVRYTIDRYAQSDQAFFSALLGARTSGAINLAAVAGVPLDQLIGGWGLALFADDYPGLASPSPDIQFSTWNLRSIYAGLNASPAWTTRWNRPFPIQPIQVDFGPFTSRVTGMRGGAHAYFEISGPARASQLVALRGVAGTAPSPSLRVALLRLQ